MLETLTKTELHGFWMRYFDAASPQRRKLSTQVFAGCHPLPPKPSDERGRYLDGLAASAAFKLTLDAFPPPKPATPLEVS